MRRFLLFLLTLLLVGCVSSGDDYRVAKEVSHYLDATHVVPQNTSQADLTHTGRIVYFAPGLHGNPHFTYYEVTSPEDMALLEAAARTALQHVSGANTVTLHFMEKQVFHTSSGGGGFRGREREIRKIVVRRPAAT